MTTALEGGEGSASRPGHSLPPGKTQYPLYRRLGGPQGRPRWVQKISPPPGFDPRTVQPIASCYTDWATQPTACFTPNRKSRCCEQLTESSRIIAFEVVSERTNATQYSLPWMMPIAIARSRNSPPCMEPKVSLPYSQQSTTCPHPEKD